MLIHTSFRRSESCERAGGKIFTATSRPSRVSFARYTSPTLPSPRCNDLVRLEQDRARRNCHRFKSAVQFSTTLIGGAGAFSVTTPVRKRRPSFPGA